MIGASKILTVSYGTFSCTLEGFDEPFNTMKAIAEYFRDLAADDRYFGAEPPTPDAAMLHRIAEREVQRRVEAKIQDNGVILRAGEFTQAPAPQPAAPIVQPAPNGLLAEESVAAKLQRIRSAVARAAVPVAPVVEDAVYVEDEVAAPIATAPVVAPPAAAAETVVAFAPRPAEPAAVEPQPEPVDDTPIAELRDQWEAIEAADEAAEDAEFAIAEEELRAVFEEPSLPGAETVEPEEVAETEETAEAQEETEVDDSALIAAITDDEPAGAEPGPEMAEVAFEDDALIAALAADTAPEIEEVHVEKVQETEAEDDSALMAALAEVEAEELHAEEPVAEADEDLGNLLASLSVDETEEPEKTEAAIAAAAHENDYEEDYEDQTAQAPAEEAAPAADEIFPDDLDEELIAATAGPDLPEWDENAEEFVEEHIVEAPEVAAAGFDDEIDSDEVFEDLPVASEPPPSPVAPENEADASPAAEKLRRARARVIKVRRIDAPAEAEPLALSPEAEADLERELAAADVDGDDDAKSEREGLSILAKNNDAEDMTRLLRQANTEMDVPENRRRMSTLAHLKAAVAATVADLRAPNPAAGTGETSRLDRYRADLARVMRPKRTDDMPVTERPAPLVLVSEQRIDRPTERPMDSAQPIRVMPRRISSGNLALDDEDDDEGDEPEATVDAENIFASSKNFIEFAERLGASDLPDLLEAAAAYTACIEGRPHFSRPHLMRHVVAVTEDNDMIREDSMRSFGQLLRQGKIEKVRRGQFAITDSSYFLAEARRMAR